MKKLGIIIAMTVVVSAYKDERRTLSPLEDFPPYQGTRQHPPFHEQHQPFREQSLKTQPYQSYRQRHYRQETSSYPERLSYRDQPFLRDYSSSKSRPFYGDSSSYRDGPDLKGQASFFIDGTSFRDHRYRDRDTVIRNEQSFHDQALNEQYSYQPQPFGDDFRYSDSYDKLTNSYKDQKYSQPESFGRDQEYLKHGNHGLGYVSMPPVSPYENALPLNEESSTTTTTPTSASPTAQPLQESTVSNSTTAEAITRLHTSATSQPKMALPVTMPSVKSDTLADSGATTNPPTPTVSTVPAASVTSKQSTNLAHPPTVLPTMASLPVMTTESPLISFGRQPMTPVEFPPSRFTPAASYYVPNGLKNKFQQSLLSYLLSQQAKASVKNNDQNSVLDYALPDVLNNSVNKIQNLPLNYALSDVLNNSVNKIQNLPLNYALPDVLNNNLNKIQSPVSSYVLPQESKDALKDNLQSSLLSYLLQSQSNRGLSFQQSSSPETLNYIPLGNTLVERPKLHMPNIPISTLSTVSRPIQSINYVSTMPRVPTFMTQDTQTSSDIPLGATLASGLPQSISETQSTNVFNSLPGGFSGISASIPGSLSSGVSTGMPTLNLAQNFQHFGQLRPFEATRSQPLSYSTGLQMQLGGFGGMDYALRSSNPAPRPLELGIAKVGLSMPELPRHQLLQGWA
ncbi:uncharacterized protein LOC128873420 [Hylaeus volcanicus]|uniref:uncharacterized protein LOC128873420 n=1 Tax=Hylaeus volcanicus TaxID=313075 RepID=UPI0023B824DF|nr:uncharacterized protein LOC128873420 [Hylaeus volcanicus]